MPNKHLTNFKVENFKRFESLEVKNIGQFNLIVGDNNVGKTCLLEALLVDENPQQLLDNFYIALSKRGFEFQVKEISTRIGDKITTEIIKPKTNYYKEYIFGKYGDNLKFCLNENQNIVLECFKTSLEISSENTTKIDIYSYDVDNLKFPLITFNDSPFDEESKSIYENLRTKREKEILINALKIINPKIVDVELRQNFDDLKSVFLLSYEDKDEYVPLNFLGDGFKRIFYIILKCLSLRNERLLIDEIEIGIHHSKLKPFLVNLMKICKELNIQLFATTHSEECIVAFLQASEITENQGNARMMRMKDYQNKLYLTTYVYENIEAGIESNVEMRG